MLYLTDDIADKPLLRKQFAQLRKAMSVEERVKSNEAVTARFLNSGIYRSSQTLMTYYSREIEVSTREVINEALLDGKKVALPVCRETGMMDFYFIRSLTELIPGKFGIPEPDVCRCELAKPDADCICLVPGLAFDSGGNRLGFGGGYYDRYLASYPDFGCTVGLCYDSCFCVELPGEPHDISVDFIITENEIIEIR